MLDDFIEKLNDGQLAIFNYLHDQFLAFPEISYKIRYKIIFYDYKSWLCYINPLKQGGVELCFIKGQVLQIHRDLLKAKNRKMIAGITIDDLKTAPLEKIMDCFAEALMLDME